MKWHGKIGFAMTKESEDEPGVWEDCITEREYYGNVLQNFRRWEPQQESINDNLKIQNRISIIADSFARANMGYMKTLTYAGRKWRISSVEIQYPRIILTLGGEWNE